MSSKFMIIGAIPTHNPETYGGVTILVQQLLEYLEDKKIEHIHIQTNKYEGKFAFVKNYISTVFSFLRNVNNTDFIFVNVASNGMYYLSPLLLFISRLLKKLFISRVFAGNSPVGYENASYVKHNALRYVYQNSDILFFETKFLVEYFQNINQNTFWFPNVRKEAGFCREGAYSKRFIYLGYLKKEKGLEELLMASNELDKSYTIDIYGTLVDIDQKLINNSKVNYFGPLEPKDVLSTMAKYDVLILPSYREGYPGVIIEAFSLGLPVIATNLQSISEIVDSSCGVLIEPRNHNSIVEAVKYFNVGNYPIMSENALDNFFNFEYEEVYSRIISICEEKLR